jgi:hypothetical protein
LKSLPVISRKVVKFYSLSASISKGEQIDE